MTSHGEPALATGGTIETGLTVAEALALAGHAMGRLGQAVARLVNTWDFDTFGGMTDQVEADLSPDQPRPARRRRDGENRPDKSARPGRTMWRTQAERLPRCLAADVPSKPWSRFGVAALSSCRVSLRPTFILFRREETGVRSQ